MRGCGEHAAFTVNLILQLRGFVENRDALDGVSTSDLSVGFGTSCKGLEKGACKLFGLNRAYCGVVYEIPQF